MNAVAQRADRDRATLAPLARAMLRPAAVVGERTVALVGCGKAKGETAAQVRELYTSPLFRKSVELASLVADAVYVTSAAHALLSLDDVLGPYDTTLRTFKRDERAAWGRRVVDELAMRTFLPTSRLRVILLMGATYADPIIEAVEARRVRVTCWAQPVDILRGLEIGQRLAFLNRAIPLARGAS